ncbi:MAG: NADH-quinone oxidoreductase subunit NuoG [Alphaproteobacteria bacterium]|nr:NADH-quinone oxidoreductase subunit NuoG [Alphaproteobacteria bacterium]MBU0798394.1 NADH-quinone oxidoreductase subunit NuoG [Alphaproteobacteria bacterium]MBU0887791.1 NADH-quinone oxidoreductase subunit NuoG [Alphaproteobacteria bacterium]MBU1814986.1 NADH-quinone oxidoreductase subunit NuoG [Alphaproteobacteria bacterium]MBU2088942.1 NADH-quinone oxidoreductase subunit NuoG [Alphaproteobacteria bacterium]
MPKVIVDGIEVDVPAGATVLQACEEAGKEIPRFCYHERLSIAGNCRMCLVEMEKAPKPIASCAFPAADGMVIKTDTPLVKKARNGVMEFLLANHPLDCPICDQGGECDLQDQAMAYGAGSSRFLENKRAVEDKYMGPLINTIMTRCIHCTRCIRFASEVAGVDDMGALYRGEHMEITTYLEGALASELSANVIDLCPVGALTSKPYAFEARPWELKKTQSVDVMDAVGSAIRVDSRGSEVMRVLPRLNEAVNEEWISDKTRYACDGLLRQRLDTPYVRKNGKLQPVDWPEALQTVAARLRSTKAEKIGAIVGDTVDVESMYALKSLLQGLGVTSLDCRQDGTKLTAGPRSGYVFNSTIAGIEEADFILLVGTNPRLEAPLVNARIRKRWLTGKLKVAAIGPVVDLTYPVTALGDSPALLADLIAGKSEISEALAKAERPMIILGQGALTRADGAAILAQARALTEKASLVRDGWNGFNVLHTAASRVGGLDIGFVPGAGGKDVAGILAAAEAGEIETVYLLAADEIDTDKLKNAFVIYQGHHGDQGAHVADVILPGAAYTEKEGIYVNTEGRVQLGRMAVFPPGDAREDWKILRALSEGLGKVLPFDTLAQLRQTLVAAYPVFAQVDHVEPAAWGAFGAEGSVDAAAFTYPISNFYMTDPISRASVTMAKCTEAFVLNSATEQTEKTGTHG